MQILEEKTILLTGGTGFLGSNLLLRLVSAGCKIVLLKRATSQLGRISNFLGYLEVYDIDVVPLMKVFGDHSIDMISPGETQCN